MSDKPGGGTSTGGCALNPANARRSRPTTFQRRWARLLLSRLKARKRSSAHADAESEISGPRSTHAIARALPTFTHGVEGYCVYTASRVVSRRIAYDPKDIPQLPGGGLPMEALPQLLGDIAGSVPFFLKHEAYSLQCEYRFVWMVAGAAQDVHFVDCPLGEHPNPASREQLKTGQ